MLTYPMTSGRNFDEILRFLDSCQRTAKYQVATPVNRRPGDDVIIEVRFPTIRPGSAIRAAGKHRTISADRAAAAIGSAGLGPWDVDGSGVAVAVWGLPRGLRRRGSAIMGQNRR
jgi:hypothetical protein